MSQEGPGKHFSLRELQRHTLGRFERRIIVRSSNETIVGLAERSALASDPSWLLEQTIIVGSGQTQVRYADDAQFSQTWDSAIDGSAFPVTPSVNNLSTLYDGVNDFCNGGNIFNFDIATAFSISMWLNPQNIAAARILFSKAGPGPAVDGYMLRHEATSGVLFLQMRSGTNRSFSFSTALVAGVWQHIVFTYAGGSNINGARVYKDAVVGSIPGSGTLSGTMLVGQDFNLGSRNAGFFYAGNMDEVTVWDKALTQAEVTELYNAGAPVDPTGHSAIANLLSWYRMGDSDTFPIISDNAGSNDLTCTNMVDASTNFVTDVP